MRNYQFDEETFDEMSPLQRNDLINEMNAAFDEARARIMAEGARLTELMRERRITLDD